jgi:DNA-directed RNA polymerase subunit M/transcription elongation factor TFIIS
MSKRRDKCKCGKYMVWDESKNIVKCKHCNTEYSVEMDSVLVYWLEEKIQETKKWTTSAK